MVACTADVENRCCGLFWTPGVTLDPHGSEPLTSEIAKGVANAGTLKATRGLQVSVLLAAPSSFGCDVPLACWTTDTIILLPVLKHGPRSLLLM